MEFHEKLVELRKKKEMTQEQVAASLYVSRTAVSKWESGKGYPNIDSLKSISRLYGITIDDLLSGEELMTLATQENQSNIRRLRRLIFASLDIMTVLLIFLPLYGQTDGTRIIAVSLPALLEITTVMRAVYYGGFLLLILLGVIQAVLFAMHIDRALESTKMASILLSAVVIIFFIMTRQPYVTAMLFMLFLLKILLLLPAKRR